LAQEPDAIDISVMTETQRTDIQPWVWPLCGVSRLKATREVRWLVVDEGRVWLTRSQRHAGLNDDIWLGPGQRHRLPAGSEWVVEAQPNARLELLLVPPAAEMANRLFGGRGPVWRLLHDSYTPRPPARPTCA